MITAVMLGGVAFTGGRGSLLGVLFGVGFIGVLTNGLILLNINQFWSNVVIGLALVAAAALDVLYRRLESMAILTPDEDIDVEDDEVDDGAPMSEPAGRANHHHAASPRVREAVIGAPPVCRWHPHVTMVHQ